MSQVRKRSDGGHRGHEGQIGVRRIAQRSERHQMEDIRVTGVKQGSGNSMIKVTEARYT